MTLALLRFVIDFVLFFLFPSSRLPSPYFGPFVALMPR